MTVYPGGRVCLSLTGPCVIDSGVNEGPPQLANRTLARLCALIFRGGSSTRFTVVSIVETPGSCRLPGEHGMGRT